MSNDITKRTMEGAFNIGQDRVSLFHDDLMVGNQAVLTILERENHLPIICVEGLRDGYYLNVFRLDEDVTEQKSIGHAMFSEELLQYTQSLKEGASKKRSIHIPYDEKNGAMLFYLDHTSLLEYLNTKKNIPIKKWNASKQPLSNENLTEVHQAIAEFVLEKSQVDLNLALEDKKKRRSHRCNIQ